jgi:tetratricopeptide (TPR) repeat protein
MRAGDQAAREEDFDRAVVAYDQILSALGPQPAVYDRLVETSLAAGRYDDAHLYLLALVDRSGWNAARRSQLADLLEQQGDTDQVAALSFAAADQTQNPRLLRRLLEQQIAQLDWSQVGATLARLLELAPDDPQTLYQWGLWLAPDDQTGAASALTQAATDPDWASSAQTVLVALDAYRVYSLTEAHTRLGIALVGLGEWAFAERVLQMALDANTVNPTARAYLGFVRDRQGRDGQPDLQAALAMSPNDPVIYYLLGQHWRRWQDYGAANQAFVQAYWLAPDNPALAAEVGASWQDLGDMAQAENWFQTAVDLAPQDIRWKRLMAAFYADTGFELEARGRAFVEATSALDPNDPDLRTSLGWVYYLSGDTERAYQELNAAVGLDPHHVRSRYYFAVMLEYRGDTQGAADSYAYVVQAEGPDRGFGLKAARALQRLGVS